MIWNVKIIDKFKTHMQAIQPQIVHKVRLDFIFYENHNF